MDLASIIGLVGGVVIVIFGTVVSGLNLMDIINIPSVLITVGGGVTSTLTSHSLHTIMNVWKYTRFAFTPRNSDLVSLIQTLVNFSDRARREGLLSLEDDLANLDEPFLKKGIQLVVDGTDPEMVRNILETDMENIHSRHESGAKFWGDLGFYFPAFGMLGTLIGLVQMLRNMGTGDSSAIGAGMAAALITTLYGSFMANIIALPLNKKLSLRDGDEMSEKSIMLEGILSIQSGDNPRIVKDKLASFLAPSDRLALEEGN